jgi:hypothetical protein
MHHHQSVLLTEKQQLAQQTHLTVKQVSDFAGNWRKRKWKGYAIACVRSCCFFFPPKVSKKIVFEVLL